MSTEAFTEMAIERETEKERAKGWKGGAERSHSLEKVTKGTYKFWLFFPAGGEGVKGIWTGLEVYVGLSTATTAAGPNLYSVTSAYVRNRITPFCNVIRRFVSNQVFAMSHICNSPVDF